MASQGTVFSRGTTQRQFKKYVLILCVVTWAAIFFISGTLFVTRRYDIANQMASSLHSSLQEQIDYLRSEITEEKTSVKFLSQVLHKRINDTLSHLHQKITVLEEKYAEKRQIASQALHSLHGSSLNENQQKLVNHGRTTAKPGGQSVVSRGPFEIKSSFNGMCVDTMEQPLGSDVELYGCHGQEGNQAWRYQELTHVIENKDKSLCLRAVSGDDGSPVKTSACDETDPQQKWIRKELLFVLGDGAQESKCLDLKPENSRVVIRHCDSTKESQRWTN